MTINKPDKYYAQEAQMLEKLNRIVDSNYRDDLKYYPDNHASSAAVTNAILRQYPEQAEDFKRDHATAYEHALNRAAGMSDDMINNPMAKLGSTDAAQAIRIPVGYKYKGIPEKPIRGVAANRLGSYEGMYYPNYDNLVLPMKTALGSNKPGSPGANVVDHELMHRGFMFLPKEQRPPETSEHNMIYNNMREFYPVNKNNKNTAEQIQKQFTVPSFNTGGKSLNENSSAHVKKYQDLARQRLGAVAPTFNP